MKNEMECMCMDCGRSNHLEMELISLEDIEGTDVKVVSNHYCLECGGAMILKGRAGEEPFYKVD